MTSLRKILYHGSRLLLGAVFLYAGWTKATDPVAFARQIAGYELLPYTLNYLVAFTLPWVELLAGALLLANHRVRPAALLLGGLDLVFILALVSVIGRGLEIDCGCFGPGSSGPTSPWAALGRDLGLLLLAVLTFQLRPAPSREFPARLPE